MFTVQSCRFGHVLIASCAVLALAACSASDDAAEEPAQEAPMPEPVLTSSPVPTVAADGSPLAVGEWTISENATGAAAAFGPPQSDALAVVACDSATKVLSLTIAGNTDGSQPYVIEAGGTAARLDMLPAGGALPMMRADIARDAPVFGGFVQPGQTFSITSPDGTVLRLPSAAGIRRIFEACA